MDRHAPPPRPSPEAVLDVLTDPDAAAALGARPVRRRRARRPAPAPRARRARVSGRLAGRRVGFDLEVHEADETGIALSASGPVGVRRRLPSCRTPSRGGSEVRASVSVRSGGGLTGRLLAEATGALLTAGALAGRVSGGSPAKPSLAYV